MFGFGGCFGFVYRLLNWMIEIGLDVFGVVVLLFDVYGFLLNVMLFCGLVLFVVCSDWNGYSVVFIRCDGMIFVSVLNMLLMWFGKCLF